MTCSRRNDPWMQFQRGRRLRSWAVGLLSIALVVVIAAQAAHADKPIVRIALLSDVEWALEPLDEIIRSEITALLEDEFEVRFPPAAQLYAGSSLSVAQTLLGQLQQDPSVDMIVAVGPTATQALATQPSFRKPSFGTIVLDPVLQGFPVTPEGATGKRNLAISTDRTTVLDILREFQNLVEIKSVAFLLRPEILDDIPALTTQFEQLQAEAGMQLIAVPLSEPLASSIESIPATVDGVIVGPLIEYDAAAVASLADALIARRLPSLSIAGSREVEHGLLATLSAPGKNRRLGRRVALQIQETLLGGDPGSFSMARRTALELTLNIATARALGVSPPYDVLARAVLLGGGQPEHARSLNLAGAIEESLERNLDLLSEDRVVAAGREDILIALTALLPQASFSTSLNWIDKDRATAGNPQRLSTTTLSGQQVVFDEFLLANYRIMRHAQDSTIAIREQVRQDVIQATGNAFLQVLSAETTARVLRDNLSVTSANLELAKTRREIGTSGPADVYRWQSEEANAEQDLVEAEAALANTRIALNRVLDRPIEEAFAIEDVALGDVSFLLADPRVRPYLERPGRLRRLRDFLVQRGLRAAPELTSFDALIDSQERLLASRHRTFYLPRIKAVGQVDHVLDEDGRGADLRPDDDERWSLGLEASIPLAEGGSRIAEARQAREDLRRLRIERRAESLRVEERIRVATNSASASFVTIDLTARAASASRRNLDIVTEQYARGAIDILELLDAQNTTFRAEQQAANAVYDHVIDLLELQRAGGRFEFAESAEDRERRIEQLELFLKSSETQGINPP